MRADRTASEGIALAWQREPSFRPSSGNVSQYGRCQTDPGGFIVTRQFRDILMTKSLRRDLVARLRQHPQLMRLDPSHHGRRGECRLQAKPAQSLGYPFEPFTQSELRLW